MELDKRQIYYVYEWYNKDNDYVFYVGKGRGHRCRDTAPADRNKPFIEYLKNNPNCTYRKIAENLDEDTACKMEDARIKELDAIGQAHCNIIKRTTHRGVMYGKDNGFYGKTHTDEIKQDIRNKLIGKFAGEENPQYGISPRERMDEETYEKWKEHLSDAMKRGGNSRATKIIAIKDENEYEFDCVLDCAEFIRNEIGGFDCTLDSTRSRISECMRCNKSFKGYSFKVQYPDEYKSSTTNVKINVGLDGRIFDCATRYCKEKNMFLSVLISKLIEDCQEISTGIKGENLKQKTFRFPKNLMAKLDDLVVKIHGHRGDVINRLLSNFLSKEGAYES